METLRTAQQAFWTKPWAHELLTFSLTVKKKHTISPGNKGSRDLAQSVGERQLLLSTQVTTTSQGTVLENPCCSVIAISHETPGSCYQHAVSSLGLPGSALTEQQVRLPAASTHGLRHLPF